MVQVTDGGYDFISAPGPLLHEAIQPANFCLLFRQQTTFRFFLSKLTNLHWCDAVNHLSTTLHQSKTGPFWHGCTAKIFQKNLLNAHFRPLNNTTNTLALQSQLYTNFPNWLVPLYMHITFSCYKDTLQTSSPNWLRMPYTAFILAQPPVQQP